MDNTKISYKLRRFLAVPFFIIGFLWILISIRDYRLSRIFYVIGGVGVFYVFIGGAMFLDRIRSNVLLNALFLVAILNYGYILAEFSMYLYIGFNKNFRKADFFSSACTEFDKVSGYRWKQGPCRMVRIARREIVFDQQIHANRQGYISRKDYSYKKSRPAILRYVAFGNSFTAGEYLEVPWPDRVEEILNASSNDKKYEFYSFGIDGGGLANWHEIFFKEIVPNYEFDGVVMACFVDSLYRLFTIFYIDESGAYFGRFTSIPEDKKDFLQNYFPKMAKHHEIIEESKLDSHIRKYIRSSFKSPAPDLYILKNFTRLFWTIKAFLSIKYNMVAHTYSDLEDKIGEGQMKKLEKIIEWCRTNNKQFFFVSVPQKDTLTNRDTRWYEYEKELQLIAKSLGVPFYSGYPAFNGLSVAEIDEHWLRHDGHWNQQGSDRYAGYLAGYIRRQSQLTKASGKTNPPGLVQ